MAEHDQQLALIVANARAELKNVVHALTAVLTSAAEGKPSPANGQLPEPSKELSLAEVLKRVDALKEAVEEATSAGEKRTRTAELQEEAVLDAEREALVRRRDALVQEVAEKNAKVKLLMDDLRELHRDIAVLLSVFNSLKVQARVRS